jgi:hypothetical protein
MVFCSVKKKKKRKKESKKRIIKYAEFQNTRSGVVSNVAFRLWPRTSKLLPQNAGVIRWGALIRDSFVMDLLARVFQVRYKGMEPIIP